MFPIQLLKDIDRLGHKKRILKIDGKAALVAIQDDVQKKRGETLLRKSPVGDSKANEIGEREVPYQNKFECSRQDWRRRN